MILTDNLNILKSSYPEVFEKLKQYEEIENSLIYQMEARSGDKTLTINRNNNVTYLHSKYNPLKEAESIIESINDLEDDSNIIFYGTGLGYHIKLILEKYTNINYFIYEPIPEILYAFLSNINLKDLKTNRLIGINTILDEKSMSKFVNRNRDKLIIIDLPSHKHNFFEEYKKFNEMFLELIKGERNSLHTNYAFQKSWIVNSMKNLVEVLSTPNIIIEKTGEFKDKTAILVAAGPSLNDEIENLKYIKENGLAYIFSVGSAINTLIYNDIFPDAACTYDPTIGDQKVFETVRKNRIKDIPLIFGSSVGFDILENYPGDKYHMITSQDTVSGYFLKNEDGKAISIVRDAPSIAVVTLQLLDILGFSNILLVGQNFGYRGKERYSEGISYSSSLTDGEIESGIWVKDVYGNEILTNDGFNSMRQQMESYIKFLPSINVINTTKGGANIEGTEFIELNDIMGEILNKKIVEKNWLNGNQTSYDKDYLESQFQNMEKAYNKALRINKDYNNIIVKIEKAINNRNFAQAESLYIKLDKELKKIENNDFYKTFILPMNRVQYKILADSIDSLNEERDPYVKGNRIIDGFRSFMDICVSDIELIEPIYHEMNETISNYTKPSLKKGE